MVERASSSLSAVQFALEGFPAAMKVVLSSGVLGHLRSKGLFVLAAGLATGRTNPALIYRFQAAIQPDKVAIEWRNNSTTFGQLDRAIDALSFGLRARGFRSGACSVIMLENRPETIAITAAMSRMGAACVAVSHHSTASELAKIINSSKTKTLFCSRQTVETVREALRASINLNADDVYCVDKIKGIADYESLLSSAVGPHPADRENASVITYTSGTTGTPKGAIRTFRRAAMLGTLQILASSPIRSDDVHLAVLPFYHATSFAFTSFSHALGATVVILDKFDPHTFLSAVEEHRVTQTALVPTLLRRIVKLGGAQIGRYDTRTLRSIMVSGEPLSPRLVRDATEVFGEVLYNYYGSTETGLNTVATPRDLRKSPGAIGRPIAGNRISLRNDNGESVSKGEVGELFVRGPMVVDGPNVYTSVGDTGRIDGRGCFHLVGRKRDMIITGGVNVFPSEIERVLETHESVFEAAVIGLPDDLWGERVCAVIVPREPMSAASVASLQDSLSAYCRVQLPGPARPKQFTFRDSLPRNAIGKVLKRDLRQIVALSHVRD